MEELTDKENFAMINCSKFKCGSKNGKFVTECKGTEHECTYPECDGFKNVFV